MNYFTFLNREIRRRPLRMCLMLLSVALGVASTASVRLASVAASAVFQQLQDAVRGRFDLEIVAEDGGRFDYSRVGFLTEIGGVESVTPLLHRTAVTYAKGRRATVTAVGFVPEDSVYSARLAVSQGHLFDTEGESLSVPTNSKDTDADEAPEDVTSKQVANTPEVLIESSFAEMMGVEIGDRISFLLPKGPLRSQVRGIVKMTEGISPLTEAAIFLKLADLQQALRAPGQIDEVRIVLKRRQSTKQVSAQIADRLESALTVRTPLDSTEFAGETLRGVEYALYFAQAMALFMGVFITLNTYMISISERRRQWGILLAIGMTRTHLMRMLLLEAFVVGMIGSILGLAFGVCGAQFLTQAIAALMRTPVARSALDPLTIAFTMALGPVLTILGSYLPARTATRIPPVEAMRGEDPQGVERFPTAAVVLAMMAWIIATLGIWLSVSSRIPVIFSIPAGIAMMLGFVLMVPPFLEPLAKSFSRVCFDFYWPAESDLAQRQVFLKPRRTALTTAVMIVALAEGIGLGHAIVNTLDDVRDWYRRALAADAVLLPNDPSQAAMFGLKASSRIEDAIVQIPGVKQVKSLRFSSVRANEVPAVVIARDFSANEPLPWSLDSTNERQVRSRITEDQIVIGSVLANRTGVSIGDRLRIERAGMAASLGVAAIVTDYNAGGLSVYMRRETALAKLGIDGVDMFLLGIDQIGRDETEKRLIEFCVNSNLTKRSFEDLQHFLDGMMSKVVAAFWGVLVVGLVIAGFGAVNTISMNVLEQTHEIGLMRVIGMTGRQIRRMIVFQALILGFLSEVFGTFAGISTAYIIHLCMSGLLMRVVAFQWRPTMIVGCNIVVVLLLVPAALLPAWRATRNNLWEALQNE